MAAKLQNPPPPTFPFSASGSAPAFSNNPFRSGQIPNPIRTTVHTSQSSVSQNSNPFRSPTHSARNSNASNHYAFPPISPIDEENESRSNLPLSRRAHGNTHHQHRTMPEPNKSVDLRKLDGRPYGRDEDVDAKPRQVRVAQDMYAGENPPGYDKQDYQGPLASKAGHDHKGGDCHKCGGHRRGPSGSAAPVVTEKSVRPQDIDCNRCGGAKSMSPSSFPRGAMANARAPARAQPTSSSEAGPSSASRGHKHSHSCGKCGRKKRVGSVSADGISQAQSPRQAGASFQSVPQIRTSGMPMVGINVEPPTAITERAPTMPFSPTNDGAPLVPQNAPTKPAKPSRTNSITSLFRSFSRRNKKTPDGPLPHQKLANQSPTSPNGDERSYSRLRPSERPKRPDSPLSFVDQPKEEQAFEMDDMRKSKQPERRNSWDKTDESTQFLATNPSSPPRPRYNRSVSTQNHLKDDLQAGTVDQPDTFLALPADQRPGITRFKSLRAGVNKASAGLSRSASQISRSTSLRRLESVKKVPQFWYRNDMAIEGTGGDEYNNYGY